VTLTAMEACSPAEQIRQLYSEFAFAVDNADFDRLGVCFTHDAEMTSSVGGLVRTRDGIVANHRHYEDRPRHNLLNLRFDALHAESARCQIYFHLVDLATGETDAMGYYDDQLVRCANGKWQIHRRMIVYVGPRTVDFKLRHPDEASELPG
jgi:hypothetical protein